MRCGCGEDHEAQERDPYRLPDGGPRRKCSGSRLIEHDRHRAAVLDLKDEIHKRHGFLRTEDLAQLVRLERLAQVLVRCGGGRFTCPAQDAAYFVGIIDATNDYVRDVSVPAGSGWLRGWRQ